MKAEASVKSSRHALEWIRRNRFGMFIHWGVYSLRQRSEWCMLTEEIPRPEYEAMARRFTGRKFDGRAVARLAKAAGMSFACMTAKHHDGFCMFDSELTDYTSVRHAAAGRDFIAEFAEGCRREGLLVGLYYSLMDWHHPDWLALQRGDRAGHERFLAYTHGQLRELFSRYGKVDLLFYDGPSPYEKPEDWRAREMNAMIRRLQPGILINDRNRLPGDFTTPEQHIQASGKGRAWQTCMTLNETWAYSRGDNMWKTPKRIVADLRRIASMDGGFLLNIGPKPDGTVPAASVRILETVGGWLKRNGESIYGATNAGCVMCACGGHTTVGDVVYIHAPQWCSPEIGVGAIESKVTRVTCLANGKPVKFKQTGTRLQLLDLPATPPDPVVTVFRIEVAGKLKLRPVRVYPASISNASSGIV